MVDRRRARRSTRAPAAWSRLAFDLRSCFLRIKLATFVPRTANLDVPASFEEELSLDGGRMRLMQVAPAFLPDPRTIRPAFAVAGEQHFECLGEAGLPGAVSPDDDGEAGAGGEREGLPGADAAEAFDGEGGEVCARAGSRRRFVCRLRGCLGVLKNASEGVAAVASGKHEGAPILLEETFGGKAIVNETAQVTVHGEVAPW